MAKTKMQKYQSRALEAVRQRRDTVRSVVSTAEIILGAGVGVALLGVALRRVLPATPVLRDVFLAPPAAGPLDDAMLDDMIGAEGTTTTRLAPAGKARIGGAVRDVTTEGELIEPGLPVRVVAVRGRRVVVRMV